MVSVDICVGVANPAVVAVRITGIMVLRNKRYLDHHHHFKQ
jgi:hypothetical protein